MRYIIYARKSSESEDRQVLSIDSQVRELQAFARSQSLQVTAVLSESRSAQAPGRMVFAQLLADIAHQRVDGILCWKLDRLARNPVDGGALIWAFDERKLQQIMTPQRTFTNTGNDKFWMQLEFGIAKKYVDDLSDNVKRGHRAKLEQGWMPGRPRVGYLNDLATKTIVPDPKRFPLVRKIWDLALAGTRPLQIREIANTQWGFRMPKLAHLGGGPITRTQIYKILSSPFYFGLIAGGYQGAHQPMITKDEFDRVQELLGRVTRPIFKRRVFAYRGLMRCGECGATITPEDKVNRFGSHYTYYRCTKRLADTNCRQRVIRVEELERQILAVLARIHIEKEFCTWALETLAEVHGQETQARAAMDASLDHAYRDSQKRLDTLTELRLRSLLTDEEYAAKRQDVLGEQLRLKERLADTDGRATKWRELTERAFIFANAAQERFETGTDEDKREILLALGSNLLLKDRILTIQVHKPFELIANDPPLEDAPQTQLEPRPRPAMAGTTALRPAPNPRRIDRLNEVRTFFVTAPDTIEWPKFCVKVNS